MNIASLGSSQGYPTELVGFIGYVTYAMYMEIGYLHGSKHDNT